MAELSLRMADVGACLPMAAAGWTRRPGLFAYEPE